MAVVEQRPAREVADPDGGAGVGREVAWVVAEGRHQRVEDRCLVTREQVDRRAVRGEADRSMLVRQRALPCRAAQGAAEPGPDGDPVVGGPGIEDRRVRDRERARDHRWAEPRVADPLQEGGVPMKSEGLELSVNMIDCPVMTDHRAFGQAGRPRGIEEVGQV